MVSPETRNIRWQIGIGIACSVVGFLAAAACAFTRQSDGRSALPQLIAESAGNLFTVFLLFSPGLFCQTLAVLAEYRDKPLVKKTALVLGTVAVAGVLLLNQLNELEWLRNISLLEENTKDAIFGVIGVGLVLGVIRGYEGLFKLLALKNDAG